MSIMYLRSPDAPFVPSQALRNEPGIFVQIPKDRQMNSLQSIVQLMTNAVSSTGSINILRILAHGNSGGLALQRSSCWVDAGNAGVFRAFANRMSPQGRVELHSCGSASDAPIYEYASPVNVYDNSDRCLPGTSSGGVGRAFVQSMANAFGVPCTGALSCQFYTENWNFEGPTITCYPSSR